MHMKTFDAFDEQFPNEAACKEYLALKRWPNGVRCPRCRGAQKIYALKARPFHWLCKHPDCGGRNGYRFSVLTATIFQDTKKPLKIWFKVGYLMLTAKQGLSALQVHRVIFGEDSGSDWRTAWYMCHRWRAAMRGDAFPLTGTGEIDETYIGGKESNKPLRKRSKAVDDGSTAFHGKIGVIGAIAPARATWSAKSSKRSTTRLLSGSWIAPSPKAWISSRPTTRRQRAIQRRPDGEARQRQRVRARGRTHRLDRLVLDAREARHLRPVPPRQQEVPAALPQRILLPPQSADQPRCLRDADGNVRFVTGSRCACQFGEA